MNRRRVYQVIALVAAIAAYTTIIVGGTVRADQAGMACPEWPLCQGSLIPNLSNPLIAIEYAHRAIAFTTSLLILVTLILTYLWYRRDVRLVVLSTASMVLLVSQVFFGMLTITSDLNDAVVTTHLALGTATFATALSLAVVSLMAPPKAAAEAPPGEGAPSSPVSPSSR